MSKLFLVFSLLLVASFCGDADYTDTSAWGDDCGGMSQSPIDINTKDLDYCPIGTYLHLEGIC